MFQMADGRPLVRLRAWADAEKRTLLGAADPIPGGWPRDRLILSDLDVDRVFLTAVDEAGFRGSSKAPTSSPG
ncbi:MAG: hypothetical protein HC923_08485 [Myxococcales bacterium]|nr:hypothetical protein [Myxococcales bacterium]